MNTSNVSLNPDLEQPKRGRGRGRGRRGRGATSLTGKYNLQDTVLQSLSHAGFELLTWGPNAGMLSTEWGDPTALM